MLEDPSKTTEIGVEDIEYDYIDKPFGADVVRKLYVPNNPFEPSITLDPGALYPLGTRKAWVDQNFQEKNPARSVEISWNPNDDVYLVRFDGAANACEFNRDQIKELLMRVCGQKVDDLEDYFALSRKSYEAVLDEIDEIGVSPDETNRNNNQTGVKRALALSRDHIAQEIYHLVRTYADNIEDESMTRFLSIPDCGRMVLEALKEESFEEVRAFHIENGVDSPDNNLVEVTIDPEKALSCREILFGLYQEEVQNTEGVDFDNYTFEDFLSELRLGVEILTICFVDEEKGLFEITFADPNGNILKQVVPMASVDGLKEEDLLLENMKMPVVEKVMGRVFSIMLKKPATPERLHYEFNPDKLQFSVTLHYKNDARENEVILPVQFHYDLLHNTHTIICNGQRHFTTYPHLKVDEALKHLDPENQRKIKEYLFIGENGMSRMADLLDQAVRKVIAQHKEVDMMDDTIKELRPPTTEPAQIQESEESRPEGQPNGSRWAKMARVAVASILLSLMPNHTAAQSSEHGQAKTEVPAPKENPITLPNRRENDNRKNLTKNKE